MPNRGVARGVSLGEGGQGGILLLYANNGHNVSLPPLTTLMKRRADIAGCGSSWVRVRVQSGLGVMMDLADIKYI